MLITHSVSPDTQSFIKNRLSTLANEHQINIIYACESGSRAWGFPSPDSDYDVRFIYTHPVSWYLTLEEDRDVIDLPIEDSPVGLLDLGGWDLRKSNPAIWEWLKSPVCYHTEHTQPFRELRPVFDAFFSPITACHHYLSICRNTMNQALNDQHAVKIKKYFYMLRPLLAAMWIARYHSVPPMALALLLPLLDDKPEIQKSIIDLQAGKQYIDEQIPIARIAIIDEFLISELARVQEAAKLLPAGKGDAANLDRLFQQCLIVSSNQRG